MQEQDEMSKHLATDAAWEKQIDGGLVVTLLVFAVLFMWGV